LTNSAPYDIINTESEGNEMKVYVVYDFFNYAAAMFMSVDKNEALKEEERLTKEGYNARTIEYDFTTQKSFQLDCD
jgi:hypothetical protein